MAANGQVQRRDRYQQNDQDRWRLMNSIVANYLRTVRRGKLAKRSDTKNGKYDRKR